MTKKNRSDVYGNMIVGLTSGALVYLATAVGDLVHTSYKVGITIICLAFVILYFVYLYRSEK